jgi:hypothetical protein
MSDYVIFHDWWDPARDQNQTGEFVFIGSAAECAAEVEHQSAIRPEWRLSIHKLAGKR